MAQRAETVLHRWFEEVWNQKRESAIDELMTEDAMVHGIAGPDGKEIRGPVAFRPFFHHFCAAFPDIRITIEVTATHTGRGVTAAPTNRFARFTGMCIVRVENGKIAEGWNNFDFLSMYQQLGMQLS